MNGQKITPLFHTCTCGKQTPLEPGTFIGSGLLGNENLAFFNCKYCRSTFTVRITSRISDAVRPK